MIRLPRLDPADPQAFPPVAEALHEPDGLLAAGGDLSPARLLAAYGRGIFPWYSGDQPILWWSPALRTVFDTANLHVSHRLRRWLRGCEWEIGVDTAFESVMRACAASRATQPGTWITPDMLVAYQRLHALGYAHCVEAWDHGDLIGGIYGVAIGRMFYGESMFSARTNGSKVALLALARLLREWSYPLLDAQVASSHLRTLGAFELPRAVFCARTQQLSAQLAAPAAWHAPFPTLHVSNLLP